MKQELIQPDISDLKEEPLFSNDNRIQTFKYQQFNSARNSLPSKILLNRDLDQQNNSLLNQGEQSYRIEQQVLQKHLTNTPTKFVGSQAFQFPQDEGSRTSNQGKDNIYRIKNVSNGQNIFKVSTNLKSADNLTNKSISQIVDEQMINQTSTYTTNIVKKQHQVIDFDLLRSIKNNNNNLLGKELNNTNSPQHFKRKSVIEVRNQAQQELEQYLSPTYNYANQQNPNNEQRSNMQYSQINKRKVSDLGLASKSSHVRYHSMDAFPKPQHVKNYSLLPSLAQNDSNSPSTNNQKSPNSLNINSQGKDASLNTSSLNNSKIVISRPKSRNSFSNSQFFNQGDNTTSSLVNTKITNLPIKDLIQKQIELKQSLFDQGNKNQVSNYALNIHGSPKQNYLFKDSYNLFLNPNEKSPSLQQDEYLCNRRKSMNMSNIAVNSYSNPTTPQNANETQMINKQNQNSQFYKMSIKQQFGTPKLCSQKLSDRIGDTFTQNVSSFGEKNNESQKLSLIQQSQNSNIFSGIQQLESSRYSMSSKREDYNIKLNVQQDDQQQTKNFNNIKSILSLSNIGNLSESTNLNSNIANVNNKSNNLQNTSDVNQQLEYSSELTSPLKSIQPITLTQINTKDYELIKNQCLKSIQLQLFSEQFHQTKFENAAKIPFLSQEEPIIKFLSLCLEELYQEVVQQQLDNYNHSFVNFKEIDMPQLLTAPTQNTLSQVQWPSFSFRYPEKFCTVFVERVVSILEQNDYVRKKITQLKKVISSNFKKYFCYRDFINEIGGVVNLPNIINQVVNQLQRKYNSQKLNSFLPDIKQFTISLLDNDLQGIDSIINKHIVFPSNINSQQLDLSNSNDKSFQKQESEVLKQKSILSSPPSLFGQSPLSNPRARQSVVNTTFTTSQAKLAQMTGIKFKKGNISSPKNNLDSADWVFNAKMFFEIKFNIYQVLSRQDYVSSQSIMVILEQIETLRYTNFRSFFGNDVALNYADHAKNIINLIPDNHLAQLLGSDASNEKRKKTYLEFFNQFCEQIFVINTSTQKLKDFCNSYKINMNSETIFLLENQINYVINAMKILPLCQRKDIKDKFLRLKRFLGIGDTFDNVNENIYEIMQDLFNYNEKQLATIKSLNNEQVQSIKQSFYFFQYLLETTLSSAGAFSHYDMGYAFGEYNLKEDSLNFWIKSLKRTLQKYNIKPVVINIIELMLTEIITSKLTI